VPDQDLVAGERPALALGADSKQGDTVLIVGDDVVQFKAQGAPRKLEQAAKEPEHSVAPVDSVPRRLMARGEYRFMADVLEQRQRIVDA
jgi:hypothetical protein